MGRPKGSRTICKICGQVGHITRVCPTVEGRTRKCCDCHKELSLSAFHVQSASSLGLSYVCKPCSAIRYKTWKYSSFSSCLKRQLTLAKVHAKKKGYIFSLVLEDIVALIEKQEGKCYYTGRLLSIEPGESCISIDKVIPSQGYIIDNIVLTSWKINRVKSDLSNIEFINLCKDIAVYHSES